MGMFTTREPRKFRRVSIYTDPDKDKLDKLILDVKREQGLLSPSEEKYDTDKFRGTFINYTPHAQRYREGRKLVWPVALVLILVLILIWHWLLTGNARF